MQKIIRNKIYQGHSLAIMQTWEPDQIDMCITSPPYYGLRNYQTEGQIWGGNPQCQHVWNTGIKKGISGGTASSKVHSNKMQTDYSTSGLVRDGRSEESRKKTLENFKRTKDNFQITEDTEYGFCDKCGAFKCELGQENTPELYIEHLMMIFREVRRVLKKTGSLWINLGDSVTYDNWIMIRENGFIKKVKIGEYINKYIETHEKLYENNREIVKVLDNIEILSINKNYECIFTKPSVFIRHKTDKTIIQTIASEKGVKYGKDITTTIDHSLIDINLNETKPQLNKKIIGIYRYPININPLETINLDLNILTHVWITFDNIKHFIKQNWLDLKGTAYLYSRNRKLKQKRDSILQDWYRNNVLPLDILKYLPVHINLPKKWYLKGRKNGKFEIINNGFVLNDNILKFMGLWIADGSYSIKNSVVSISTGNEPESIELCKKICSLYELYFNRNIKGDLDIHSEGLIQIMYNLGFTGDCYSKRIPNWVYNLNKHQIQSFLDGYILGDGSDKANNVSFCSVNKDLRDDIVDLFRFIGQNVTHCEQIVGHCVSTFKNSKRCYIGRLVDEHDLKKHDCIILKTIKIDNIDYNNYVYDISVPETEMFVCNGFVLHNTYSGSGGSGGDQATHHPEEAKYRAQGTNARERSLMGIPFLFAIAMIQEGFILRNTVIWWKGNVLPHSCTNRFTTDHEYLFFFTMEPSHYYFKQQLEPIESGIMVHPSLIFGGYNGNAVKDYIGAKAQNPSDTKRRILASQQQQILDMFKGMYSKENQTPEQKEALAKFESAKSNNETTGNHQNNQQIQARDYLAKTEILKYYSKYREETGSPHVQGFLRENRVETERELAHKLKNDKEFWKYVHDHGFSVQRNVRTVWHLNEDYMMLRSDLTNDQRKWVIRSLLNYDITQFLIKKEDIPVELLKYFEGIPSEMNKTTILRVNTSPCSDAHFAVFPGKLLERPIDAGCPTQICMACGKAREWIVDNETCYDEIKDDEPHKQTANCGSISGNANWTPPKRKGYWSKCDCDQPFQPGIVYDPFFGSGTTGMKALEMGRYFVGIELNPEYVKIANKRILPYLNNKLEDYFKPKDTKKEEKKEEEEYIRNIDALEPS